MTGRVVSVKTIKTATVLEERVVKHPLYKKTYKQSKKYLVHDEVGVKLGDIVEFVPSKSISKNKHWRIVKVLGKNFAEIAEGKLKQEAEKTIAAVMPEEKVTEEAVEKVEEAKEKTEKVKKTKEKK
jgi:small subunit ribosomal protein S17